MADSDKGIAHRLRTFFSAIESALSQPAPRWDPSRPGRTLASRLPLGELAVAAILVIVGVGVAVNVASSHRNLHGGPVTSTTPQASSTATPPGASPTPSPTTLVLASPSASPIPRPTGPYYGVLVDRTRSGSAPGNYTLALVASNGMISTTIHPASPPSSRICKTGRRFPLSALRPGTCTSWTGIPLSSHFPSVGQRR